MSSALYQSEYCYDDSRQTQYSTSSGPSAASHSTSATCRISISAPGTFEHTTFT